MSGEQKLDRSVLEGKKADELKAIANKAGVPLSGRPTKAGVIDQILSFTGVAVSDSGSDTKPDGQEGPQPTCAKATHPRQRQRAVQPQSSTRPPG